LGGEQVFEGEVLPQRIMEFFEDKQDLMVEKFWGGVGFRGFRKIRKKYSFFSFRF